MAILSDQIQAIAEKLELLRQMDQKHEIFGAHQHKYNVDPTLTVQAVLDLLPTPEFKLPGDYLEFIQCIGDGGAGPAYGLLSLKDSFGQSIGQKPLSTFRYVAAWQPLFGGYTWDELEDCGKLDDYMDMPVTDEQRAEYDAWSDEYAKSYHLDGALTISDDGCGHAILLIVSGIERGHIWCDSRISDAGILPLGGSNQRVTFFDWYENWLDDSIKELRENA